MKTTLGNLLTEVGHPEDDPSIYDFIGPAYINISNVESELNGNWDQGPDGTRILRGQPPDGYRAITLGGTIIVQRNRQLPWRESRALLAHEYTHVLQYRALGVGFLGKYRAGGGADYQNNPLEVQGIHIEGIYASSYNDWLPPPWDFGGVAP